MKSKGFIWIILVSILICGCSDSNTSMTEVDREFDGYANDAAEQFLKQEADEHTWTNIKTGELEYRYTLYNEELNIYEVGYLAEFNEEDHTEDQWIEIQVILTGNTKSVEEVSCTYWDAASYEMNYNMSYGGRKDKDGEWKNINLLEDINEQK